MIVRGVALSLCILALALAGAGAGAEAAAQKDPDAAIVAGAEKLPGLTFRLVVPRERYELGEPVEVTMLYTYRGERMLRVEVVKYDLSGRIRDFWFTAEDQEGKPVRDPIKAWRYVRAGGGRTGRGLARGKPYEQKAVINEWVCFDRPGRYRLTAHSKIVSFDYYGTGSSGPSIPLEGEPVEIELVPPDENRRLERIARAAEIIRTGGDRAREKAMRELRFMVDGRAVPLLMRGVDDPFGNAVRQAMFGLHSYLDLAPVKAAVLKAIDDETQILTPHAIWRYAELMAHAQLRSEGDEKGRFGRGYCEVVRRWCRRLGGKFGERLEKYPTLEAAKAAVQDLGGMQLLSPSEPANWKRIVDNARRLPKKTQERAADVVAGRCRCKELIPDLRGLAADEAVSGSLRSAAVFALHAMGDASLRDMVAGDLISPKPKLLPGAHATLGDYKARAIAEALLRLVRSEDRKLRKSAAERIRDFGTAASAGELRAAVRGTRSGEPALLQALAVKSPRDAVPFIRDIVHNPAAAGRALRHAALRLLSRIDSPAAQEVILDLLRSPDADDRKDLLHELRNSSCRAQILKWGDQAEPSFRHFAREMPPKAGLPAAFFPEFFALYKSDPSGEVSLAARGAVREITRIPGPGFGQKTMAEVEKYLPEWKSWWEKNGARYARWGRTRRGLAIKCSTDKGVYDVGEQILATIRCRRVSAGEDARLRVRLRGRVDEPGAPSRSSGERFDRYLFPEDLRETLPGPEPGSEVVRRLELGAVPGCGRLDRPCTLRFRVRYVFTDDTKPWGTDAAESYPVTIHIRELPEGKRSTPRETAPD